MLAGRDESSIKIYILWNGVNQHLLGFFVCHNVEEKSTAEYLVVKAARGVN